MTDTTDLQIIKEDEFRMYLMWKSLPPLMRFPPKDRNGNQTTSEDFCDELGVDNPMVRDLVNIKRQKDFAERFKVDEDTLTAWNKKIRENNLLDDIRTWANEMTRNIVLSLYSHTVRKGNPLNFKLWFQIVSQWEEKLKVEHEGAVTEIIVVTNDENQKSEMDTQQKAVESVALPQ
jgi:hypothetical protein